MTGAQGFVQFIDSSTASDATIINNGATLAKTDGGETDFFNNSTADNATLISDPGSNGGNGGSITFLNDSTGGTSRIEVFGNGRLDISPHNSPGLTIGSLEGDGNVFLGLLNLTVGSNDQSTTFSGVLEGGGLAGIIAGSFSKIGLGTLTLSGDNAYTGPTSINGGRLLANNTFGSATGTGPVIINNSGTLGGTGSIVGPVIINPGGTINPGKPSAH